MTDALRMFFLGVDLGSAKNLSLLANAAQQAGHRVYFIGNSPSLLPEQALSQFDLVMTGLASVKNQEELAIGQLCGAMSVPWVILSDTHGSWGRQNAKDKVGHARLIVASPMEIDEAGAFGYGNVKYLGGPPLWQEFWKVRGTREQLTLLKGVEALPLIHVGGIKHSGITNTMLGAVTTACDQLFDGGWQLLFKPHPNEAETFTSEEAEIRTNILSRVKTCNTPFSSSELIDLADISVFTCGATGVIEAAYRRRPVIYWEDDAVRERVAQQTTKPLWFPVEAGVALKATDFSSLKQALRGFATNEVRNALQKQQELVYPKPAAGQPPVEQSILKFLEAVVSKHLPF